MKYTIIGAGIGGLTTALAFEQNGIEYQVFERAPIFSKVGAGIWLAPNALQVFDTLRILDDIKQKGNSINSITIAKSDLSTISNTIQSKFEDTFGCGTVAIHRAELLEILAKAIPKEKITLGKAFKSFEQSDTEGLIINFDDDSTTSTDFLIGADGINSKVRTQLFPKSKTRYSGQTCWRGVSGFVLDGENGSRAAELWGNQIRFGFSKISNDKVYWFAVALDNPNQKDEAHLVKEKLLNMYCAFHPLVIDIIEATPGNKILRNDICDLKPMKDWYKGNVCLIGDAAHAATPNLGQGGAQAIEDAYYLTHLIKRKPDQNNFSKFQQKRKAKVNEIVKQSWATGKIAHLKYGKWFRNQMMKNIPVKLMERKMMELYKVEKY